MISNSMLLLKILFLNQFKINELKEKDSKYRRNVILVGISIIIVFVMMAVYSFAIGWSLGVMGIAKVIPGYGITIVSLITLFFSIFKSNGILFGMKDYDMIVALPFRTRTIVASRFLYMYIMNTLFALVIMIPLGLVYYMFEKPTSFFFFTWFCGIFLSTLLPTALAAMIGGLIAYIASHFKYTNVVSILLSLALVIGIILSSMSLGSMDESSTDLSRFTQLGEQISKQINSVYPPSELFEKAINNQDIAALLSFIIISVAWYVLFVQVLSLKYKSIHTAIFTHSTKSNYKIQNLKTSSVLKALYRKEIKRFFSSYAYVLNVGMGAIMAFIMVIAVFVLNPEQLERIAKIPNIQNMLIKIIAFVFSAVIAMSCTTSVALSLEGKNLWILKSLPIGTKTIMNSKILVNLTITIPIAILFGILMNLKWKTDFITRIMLFIIPIIYSILSAVWGMFINIKLPNYDWESETTVIKQGMSSAIGMLGGPVFAIVPVLIILAFQTVPYQIFHIVITLIVAGIAWLLYRNIIKYQL
ncbi:ABC-2 type transport system permease protein [Lachnotalea glycerini]|uniref:ABC-2 type transport system permease protein n=1 Tax=Lachnotalea glycerini TaxID=1763509 RepID=A0A318EX84_9FIRM|nr:permease [Lachnotalea glycerini]PXV96113.1 ABC-2 type transport system permease protein [Lachnotalea glycerini]